MAAGPAQACGGDEAAALGASAEEESEDAAATPQDNESGDGQGDKDDVCISLEEIKLLDIAEMAKDKSRSRTLQRSLIKGAREVKELICEKAEPHFMELVRDQYGNYLTQKVLEVCDSEQYGRLFAALEPHLKELAQDMHGTRAVQKIVEQSITRGEVEGLLAALPGELAQSLAQNITGFHVVVKLIESLPITELEKLLDLLCGSAEKACALGKDQWGCCVLKKCVDRVDKSDGPVRQKIIDSILNSTVSLVQDPFGNYVVQHLILMGARPNPHVTRVIDALKGQMFELSMQKFSSNVLEKCLQNSSDKDRNKIINEILNPSCCLPSQAVQKLLFHQYGNYVFQQALEVANEPQFSLLVEHSKQHIKEALQRSQSEMVSQPAGNLAGEHVRRLGLKLVKKYPALSGNFEFDASSTPWNHFGDPYAAGNFGAEAYTAWAGAPLPSAAYGYSFPAWDSNFGGCSGTYSQKASNRTRSKNRKGEKEKVAANGKVDAKAKNEQSVSGDRSKVQNANSSAKGGGTMRVGRIVGFWPNYVIVYDEVPAAGASNSRSGRGKKKTKDSQKKTAAAAESEQAT